MTAGHGTRAQELIGSELASSIQRLMRAEAGIRRGDDPETVHQARVATRRIRTTLGAFKTLLDARWADTLRKQLAELADVLGAARDADVMLLRLDARIALLQPRDAAAAHGIRAKLATRQTAAHDALTAYLDGPSHKKLIPALSEAAARPRFRFGDASDSGDVLDPIRVAWEHLRSAVDVIGSDPSSSDLHRVRLLTKRVRYTAETVASVVGPSAERFAVRAAALQDTLGELQDATVASEWLRDVGVCSTPTVAYAAGSIATAEANAAANARKSWASAWERLSRRKNIAWLDR